MITLNLQNGGVQTYVYKKRGAIQLELWDKDTDEMVTMSLGQYELGVVDEYLDDIAEDVLDIMTGGD